MERKKSKTTVFLWTFIVGLVSQNLILPVACRSFQDQKNYYPPDPSSGSGSPPSSGSNGSPSHGAPGGSSGNCGTPPSHGSHHHTPSHGSGGGSYGTPPSTPSTPTPSIPLTPTPSTPTDPSPSSGGGGYYNPPTSSSPPSHGSHHHTPSPGSGGGSYGTPPSTPSTPTPSIPSTPTPSTPTDPSPPSGGGGYYDNPPTSGSPPYTPTPTTPIVLSPPPYTPTPIISTPPSPLYPDTPPSPLYPDPNSPPVSPGTCTYWGSHPDLIWALFGWWGKLGSIMGLSPSTPHVFGSTDLTLPQALENKRTDGIGALYREGTASLLNSMVNTRFPFSTEQVRDHFAAALVSNKAANSQAEIFRKANEGQL